ncbi:MAG: DUF916 domain-containing protein [bacterium]
MKNQNNHITLLSFLVVFVLSFLLFAFKSVFAQDVLPLLVAPARQELFLDPGETTSFNFRFANLSSTPVAGVVKVADFIVNNNEGIPDIIENNEDTSLKYSASKWITLPVDRIAIAAKDKVSMQASIEVPKDAKAGGRYAAIYFEPEVTTPDSIGTQKEAGVGTSSRIVLLVYIRISGDIKEAALIDRLYTKPFFEFGPISVETDILNRGDYHVRPKGVIALQNQLGKIVSQASLKEQNIFPDTKRTFNNEVGSKWMFGRYKLTLTAAYGEAGQSISRSTFVWVIPWRIILIAILSIIIIWLIIKNVKKRSEKNNEFLKSQLEVEKEEIEKLKKQLDKRSD